MTLLLSDESVREVLDPVVLVDEIEAAIRAELAEPSVIPGRLNLGHGSTFFRIMPAMVPGMGMMGLKTFFGGGSLGVRYVILVASMETGELQAIVDACYLTAARTAATSAVAARALGVKSAVIGVLGSGLEAETHVRTFHALGGVEQVKVFSPNPTSRERFALRLREAIGVDVEVCGTAEAACIGVDHLITATNTGYGGPIACDASWIGPGTHVSAIGSTHPRLREHDPVALDRADILVLDADPAQVGEESGDVRAWIDAGGSLTRTLQLDDLVQELVAVPGEPQDISMFKSVGTALQDLVAAGVAYRCAVGRDVGHRADDLVMPKTRR
jgi:ornithine cyclodeaminase/alanine dehydrogenase-like protein (mu-crystallin family)